MTLLCHLCSPRQCLLFKRSDFKKETLTLIHGECVFIFHFTTARVRFTFECSFDVFFSVMESYEDFIQRHRESPADDDEDEESVRKPSSVIVFHRVCVLPPLV